MGVFLFRLFLGRESQVESRPASRRTDGAHARRRGCAQVWPMCSRTDSHPRSVLLRTSSPATAPLDVFTIFTFTSAAQPDRAGLRQYRYDQICTRRTSSLVQGLVLFVRSSVNRHPPSPPLRRCPRRRRCCHPTRTGSTTRWCSRPAPRYPRSAGGPWCRPPCGSAPHRP